jgi:metacaspase-1
MIMAKGISIHIGVNHVDRKVYDSECKLPYCVNDANAMRAIATARGFDWLLLLNEGATKKRLLDALSIAAACLNSGDILLLSFSGHGDSLADNDEDEADKRDESWVMYDGRLRDDLLYAAWKEFKEGVRIVVVSDSCHSGTMLKPAEPPEDILAKYQSEESAWHPYRNILSGASIEACDSGDTAVKASVILLAACEDSKKTPARGGKKLSWFTQAMMDIWDNGSFTGDYHTLLQTIGQNFPDKNPQFQAVGWRDSEFEMQPVFTI